MFPILSESYLKKTYSDQNDDVDKTIEVLLAENTLFEPKPNDNTRPLYFDKGINEKFSSDHMSYGKYQTIMENI